jgi:hypothetical protein
VVSELTPWWIISIAQPRKRATIFPRFSAFLFNFLIAWHFKEREKWFQNGFLVGLLWNFTGIWSLIYYVKCKWQTSYFANIIMLIGKKGRKESSLWDHEIIVRSSWDRCEIIVRSLWDHCEIVVRSLWDHIEIVVRSLWDYCEIILRSLWDHCEIIVRSYWDRCEIIVRSREVKECLQCCYLVREIACFDLCGGSEIKKSGNREIICLLISWTHSTEMIDTRCRSIYSIPPWHRMTRPLWLVSATVISRLIGWLVHGGCGGEIRGGKRRRGCGW